MKKTRYQILCEKAEREHLECILARDIKAKKLPEPKRNYKFASDRNYASDFAYLEIRLLIEVEGGTWMNGRHNRPEGYEEDCKKYNLANLLGWTILRYTSEMVKSGYAIIEINDYVLKKYSFIKRIDTCQS